MHPVVNKADFVKSSLDTIAKDLAENSEKIRSAIGAAIKTTDPEAIEKERASLADQFASIRKTAVGEPSHGDRDLRLTLRPRRPLSVSTGQGLQSDSLVAGLRQRQSDLGRNPHRGGCLCIWSFLQTGLRRCTWPERTTHSINIERMEGA